MMQVAIGKMIKSLQTLRKSVRFIRELLLGRVQPSILVQRERRFGVLPYKYFRQRPSDSRKHEQLHLRAIVVTLPQTIACLYFKATMSVTILIMSFYQQFFFRKANK